MGGLSRKKAESHEQGKQKACASTETGLGQAGRSATRLGQDSASHPPPASTRVGPRTYTPTTSSPVSPAPPPMPAGGSPIFLRRSPSPSQHLSDLHVRPVRTNKPRVETYTWVSPACPWVQIPSTFDLELPPRSPGDVSDQAIQDMSLDGSQGSQRKYTHTGWQEPPRTHRRGTSTHSRSHATHKQRSPAPGPRARPGVSHLSGRRVLPGPRPHPPPKGPAGHRAGRAPKAAGCPSSRPGDGRSPEALKAWEPTVGLGRAGAERGCWGRYLIAPAGRRRGPGARPAGPRTPAPRGPRFAPASRRSESAHLPSPAPRPAGPAGPARSGKRRPLLCNPRPAPAPAATRFPAQGPEVLAQRTRAQPNFPTRTDRDPGLASQSIERPRDASRTPISTQGLPSAPTSVPGSHGHQHPAALETEDENASVTFSARGPSAPPSGPPLQVPPSRPSPPRPGSPTCSITLYCSSGFWTTHILHPMVPAAEGRRAATGKRLSLARSRDLGPRAGAGGHSLARGRAA